MNEGVRSAGFLLDLSEIPLKQQEHLARQHEGRACSPLSLKFQGMLAWDWPALREPVVGEAWGAARTEAATLFSPPGWSWQNSRCSLTRLHLLACGENAWSLSFPKKFDEIDKERIQDFYPELLLSLAHPCGNPKTYLRNCWLIYRNALHSIPPITGFSSNISAPLGISLRDFLGEPCRIFLRSLQWVSEGHC